MQIPPSPSRARSEDPTRHGTRRPFLCGSAATDWRLRRGNEDVLRGSAQDGVATRVFTERGHRLRCSGVVNPLRWLLGLGAMAALAACTSPSTPPQSVGAPDPLAAS